MAIDLIAVGKLKERYWREAAAEYEKRLSAYAQLRVFELPDRSEHGDGPEALLKAEAVLIIDCLKRQRTAAPLILLDIGGVATSSEHLATRLSAQEASGNPRLTFIIGGSHGVAAEIRKVANERLSFGQITLPHNLARIVLLEQLYRACRINRGEPYHK
ncbi:MAG: 23S rRNA (pseudouridine(1915)-N(3))-methyltransferase RlmH [Actinomycetia bacterium]|nr:23S rRNA (pseudouridine(1915)-N(3))-methyltransferase RlmH [Actinomycetes bacterium]